MFKVYEQAAETGREHRADFKLIAKVFDCIGNVYVKRNDLDKVIKYFNMSLTEYCTAEKKKKKNSKSNFLEAAKHYTEVIKRIEKDPSCYSNRKACYTKLMVFHEPIKDCGTY
ncbi:hypothetical protein K502DRAFT_346003 [Neoconidiobolus thromboides FSU 785]|nr:hypothetical protein K502DRAFT_346003 [Neoconidiobolus thromboides FSU 785]